MFGGRSVKTRLQHGAADDVFRRDQLDFMPLATEFALDGGGDLGTFGPRQMVGAFDAYSFDPYTKVGELGLSAPASALILSS